VTFCDPHSWASTYAPLNIALTQCGPREAPLLQAVNRKR